jgi:hypothetical protein
LNLCTEAERVCSLGRVVSGAGSRNPEEVKLRGGGAEACENGLDMGRENTGNKNKRIQGRAFCGRELRRENILRLEKGQKTKKELSVEVEWEGGTRAWQQGSGNRL